MQLIVKIQNSLPPSPKGEFGKNFYFNQFLLNKIDDDTLHQLPLLLSNGLKKATYFFGFSTLVFKCG